MQTHTSRGTGLVFSHFLAGNACSGLFVHMESDHMWGFFVSGVSRSALCPQGPSLVWRVSALSSLPWLRNIPLCGRTPLCLSVCPQADPWTGNRERCTHILGSPWQHVSRSQISSSRGNAMFPFLSKCQTTLHSGCPIFHAHEGSDFSTSRQHVSISMFGYPPPPSGNVETCHCDFEHFHVPDN